MIRTRSICLSRRKSLHVAKVKKERIGEVIEDAHTQLYVLLVYNVEYIHRSTHICFFSSLPFTSTDGVSLIVGLSNIFFLPLSFFLEC